MNEFNDKDKYFKVDIGPVRIECEKPNMDEAENILTMFSNIVTDAMMDKRFSEWLKRIFWIWGILSIVFIGLDLVLTYII